VRQPAQAASSLIPIDIALGRGDFYDIGALYSDEIASAEMYYRFLNSGFRIPATGGTDNFSDVWRDPPPGADRTYVKVDGPLTVAAWMDGIRARRTFMSTGPLVFLDVNGHEPGDEVMLAAGAPAGVRVQAEAISIAPIGALEIIVNGKLAHTVNATDSARITIDRVVAVPDGGWIAARVTGPPSRRVGDSYAFAHTSPVWVTRPGRSFTSAEDAAFLAQAVDALWARVQRAAWRSPAERDRFQAAVVQARAVYAAIAQQAERDR
jgi:TolB protein